MSNIKHYIFLIFLCYKIISENVCNLRLADNKLSVFKGNDIIFDNGKLNNLKYDDNALVPYISENFKDIEYFYAWEIHKGDNQHVPLKLNISSNDTSILVPEIKSYDDKTTEIYLTTIEIIYNCKTNSGNVKMKFSVIADNCNPFDVYWIKNCKEKVLPNISVGISNRANDILEDGKVKDTKYIDPNSIEKFIIPKDITNLSLYIKNGQNNQNLIMKEPLIVYDENLLNVAVSGFYSKGGIISNNTDLITFTFACTSFKQGKNDFEVSLSFENNEMINLYFSKECDTIGEVQEYFNFFYTIYYILLMVLFGFVITVLYYYFKRNDISVLDIYNNIKNKLNIVYNYIRDKINRIETKKNTYKSNTEQLYDETDLSDINIKTETRFKQRYASDYGGI